MRQIAFWKASTGHIEESSCFSRPTIWFVMMLVLLPFGSSSLCLAVKLIPRVL